MFHHLRKAFKWLEQPYEMVRQIIVTDSGGEKIIASSRTFTIYANIQNKADGREIVMGRDAGLVYATIILLCKNRIGFGDPVYPDTTNGDEKNILFMDNPIFHYMDNSALNFNSQYPTGPNDPILYFIKAFGQVYRIMLEGGVQDLKYDPGETSEPCELNGYVYYRYYADLVRGPWQLQ